MILKRAALAPAKHVPSRKGRWSRVAVSHRGIEATDGYVLVRTHRTDLEEHDKVPVVPGIPRSTNTTFAHRIMVEAADLAYLLDRRGSEKKWNEIIHLVRIKADEGRIFAVITDRQRHHEVLTLNLPKDQSWPDADRLIANQEQPVAVVEYDIGLLKKVVDTLVDAGARSVQFTVTGPKTGTYFAAICEGGDLIDGILMPMRSLGNLPTKGESWNMSELPETADESGKDVKGKKER